MRYVAVCHTCQKQHNIEFDPKKGPGFNAFSDWYTKHPMGHETEFLFPGRSPKPQQFRKNETWEEYLHNADVKVAYAASSAVTITLASLAASASLLAGRESTAIDNGATNVKYLDRLAAGNYKSAASNNQAGTIYTCLVAARDDTPTWPDVFDGTDSAETVSKSGVFTSICRILSVIGADNTASQTWPWGISSVAQMFGGIIPDQYVYFVTQSIQTSTNAWSSTAGDHAIYETPVYATVS